MKKKLHFSNYRALMVLALGLFFNLASAQRTLITSPYLETFGNDPSVLPTGWTVRTGGSATSIGTSVGLVTPSAPSCSWANTTGNFRSAASVSALGATATETAQFAATNRAIAIRTTGSFGENGGSFVLQLENTLGKGNFSLDIVHMVFDSQPRTTNFIVEYSKSANGTSGWVQIGNGSTAATFGASLPITYTIGSGMNNHNGPVWIRIRVTSSTGSGNRDTFGIDNFKLSWDPITSWNGTSWVGVGGGTPSATVGAIIEGDYNTATNGVFPSPLWLTVNAGATFTVATGTTLNVENAITNDAGVDNFVMENNANIIQSNVVTNVGSITVKRNSAPIVRLDHTLWSSPMSGIGPQKLNVFSPNTLPNRFYTYNSGTDQFEAIAATTNILPGRAYGIRAPNDWQAAPALAWEGVFKGNPYSRGGDLPIPVSGTGFKLIGNPYPSTVDGTAFVNANMNRTQFPNSSISGTLYFYAHSLAMNADGTFPTGTNYSTWNLGGYSLASGSNEIPNGIIQVGQGFFVQVLNPTGTDNEYITWSNSMRVGNTGNQFFRTANQTNSEIERHRIWLNLTGLEGAAFNQIMIGYITGTTLGVDPGYDGLAFGNSGSYISTRIADEDYVIQSRPLPFEASDIVPVVFHAATSGTYAISLSNMDGMFSENQDVYLKDNVSGTLHNLKSGSYTFSAAAGTFTNRFEVVYQNALSTPEATFTANSVIAFKKGNVLNVQSKNAEMASIKAYDVQGRLVYTKSGINANDIALSDLRVQNGVLLLQVTSVEGATATVKVIY